MIMARTAGLPTRRDRLRAVAKEYQRDHPCRSTGQPNGAPPPAGPEECKGIGSVPGHIAKLRLTEVPITLSPDGRSRPPHLRSWHDGWRHLSRSAPRAPPKVPFRTVRPKRPSWWPRGVLAAFVRSCEPGGLAVSGAAQTLAGAFSGGRPRPSGANFPLF